MDWLPDPLGLLLGIAGMVSVFTFGYSERLFDWRNLAIYAAVTGLVLGAGLLAGALGFHIYVPAMRNASNDSRSDESSPMPPHTARPYSAGTAGAHGTRMDRGPGW